MPEWRSINAFPAYEVSDEGGVRDAATHESIRTWTSPSCPYLTVSIPRMYVARRVHQLVAEAFIGPRPAGLVTRHKDGDPSNARLDNLHYGTQRENMLDRLGHGTDPWVNRTHCGYGHEYAPENTYYNPSKPRARVCRACRGTSPKPPGVVRTYGKGSLTQRVNGLWVARLSMPSVDGKRRQLTATSMDRETALAKLEAARASL